MRIIVNSGKHNILTPLCPLDTKMTLVFLVFSILYFLQNVINMVPLQGLVPISSLSHYYVLSRQRFYQLQSARQQSPQPLGCVHFWLG